MWLCFSLSLVSMLAVIYMIVLKHELIQRSLHTFTLCYCCSSGRIVGAVVVMEHVWPVMQHWLLFSVEVMWLAYTNQRRRTLSRGGDSKRHLQRFSVLNLLEYLFCYHRSVSCNLSNILYKHIITIKLFYVCGSYLWFQNFKL